MIITCGKATKFVRTKKKEQQWKEEQFREKEKKYFDSKTCTTSN